MINRRRKSAVLILALLMMGAIVGSGLVLSTVIADSSHQTQTLNDFISASLVADSGIERGLAVVKLGRASQTQTVNNTATKVAPPAAIPGLTLSGQPKTDSILGWPSLRPGESVSFDLFSTDGTQFRIAQLLISGNGSFYTPSAGPPNIPTRAKLEVSWVGLSNLSDPIFFGRRYLNSIELSGTLVNLFDVNYLRSVDKGLVINTIGATNGFRLRLTALDEGQAVLTTVPAAELADASKTVYRIDTLRVSGITAGGAPTNNGFPSRIEITSLATINKSQSQKKVSVPWQFTSSSAFRYVLFTEGEIIPTP